jgi:putative ATPase
VDLFALGRKDQIEREAPLAARMRPRDFDEFVGQEQIVGPGKLLRRAIEADRLFSSIILWGPPGTGKTTLAQIISRRTESHFESLSAVLAGKPELRKLVDAARERRNLYGRRTILLVDEIHRWNKAQQDALLPNVEDGTIVLVGSTTENPYFEVISPLVSRSRVFQLRSLSEGEIVLLLQRALEDRDRGYGRRSVTITEEAVLHLARVAGGDARAGLNALELAVESTPPGEDGTIRIDLEVAQDSIQKRALRYDRVGDEHYDTISAFIKSVRGSDPDAALYWLAKMVYAGEDPRFIMRRLLILAAEDIGLADPLAVAIVAGCARALEWCGLPEAQYHLAEATLYLATAPKSNSVGAYWKALAEIEEHGAGAVPLHLRDASRDGPALGHGKGYLYAHAHPGHWVQQRYLPEEVEGGWFRPGELGYERLIRRRLERLRRGQEPFSEEGEEVMGTGREQADDDPGPGED